MRRSDPRWLWASAVIIVVAAVVAGAFWFFREPAYAFHGGEYVPPRAAPAIELTDQFGEAFSLADHPGKVSMLYFGYTTCPDLCPTTLSDFAVVKGALGDAAEDVNFVLITFDPERDTPERLRQYLSFFDDDFIGVSGEMAETEAILQEYGVTINRVEYPESATGYLIDHTALIYVIDAEGRLRLSYPYGTPPDSMAADIQHLLGN